MEKRIAKGTFLHDLPDFVEKLRISHLPVMRLLGIFTLSFRQIARYLPQKTVQICSTTHHNISDDTNINSI